MGKVNKSKAAGSALDTDVLSLHTTPDDYDYDDLPTYNDSEATASASNAALAVPMLNAPTLNHHQPPLDEYAPLPTSSHRPLVQIGKKTQANETTSRMDEKLDDPYHLYAYVMDVVRMIPPKPLIHIVGTHQETTTDSKGSKSKQQVTDFDIYLNLQPCFRPALDSNFWHDSVASPSDKTYRGSFRRTKAQGITQGVQLADEFPDLKEWCEKYCEDKSMLKVFRVEREIHHLDTVVLDQLIAGLVRSTEYRGHLKISFPIENRYVDIYSPHIINQWRNSWIRYIFYFSMLWIITWPILFFMTKWYAVYSACWDFSRPVVGTVNDRRFATVSERSWYERHKNYIKHLVLNKTHGEADSDPCIVESYNDGRPIEAPRAGTGDAHLDSAIGVVAGGLNVWQQIRGNRFQMPSTGAWGYDT